jgi:hypothetical protein
MSRHPVILRVCCCYTSVPSAEGAAAGGAVCQAPRGRHGVRVRGRYSGQITVPQAWTDRGEPPPAHRLSAECLAGLDTLTHRLPVGGGRTLSHGRP